MMKRVLVDIDAGTDDALALLLLLTAQLNRQVEIMAITCVHGNTDLENVHRNVRRILQLCGQEDIPVYRGAREPLLLLPPDSQTAVYYHGRDGFGDLQYEPDNVTAKDNEHNRGRLTQRVFPRATVAEDVNNSSSNDVDPATVAMNRIVAENAGDISLICLGPLTNVALAMKVYGQFAANLKEIFLMGGNHRGVGNVTSAAEFNFHVDPEAAYIVLHYAKCPITILPWEPCMASTIPLDWRYNTLGKAKHPAMPLLTAAERRVYGDNEPFWLPCDAFLVAAFLHPTVAKACLRVHASVELQGHRTRAQMVLDHLNELAPNVAIITELNFDLLQSILGATFI